MLGPRTVKPERRGCSEVPQRRPAKRNRADARASSPQLAVAAIMRLCRWIRAGLMALVLLVEEGNSYAPSFPITNRTFIQQYIDAHNYYRGIVNPTAGDMLYMTFDLALAKIARAWATKCLWKHNPGTSYHPDPKLRPSGENMWMGSGRITSFDPGDAIRAFYQEDKYYDYIAHTCSHVCGHYTQVVWANSYKVGCALALCSKVDGKKKNALIFVCNYSPAGNYKGVRPYVTGQPCNQCPVGDTCENNLCRNIARDQEYTRYYLQWNPPFDDRFRCDGYCISVAILRPLFFFLTFAAVYGIQIKYPNLTV